MALSGKILQAGIARGNCFSATFSTELCEVKLSTNCVRGHLEGIVWLKVCSWSAIAEMARAELGNGLKRGLC